MNQSPTLETKKKNKPTAASNKYFLKPLSANAETMIKPLVAHLPTTALDASYE